MTHISAESEEKGFAQKLGAEIFDWLEENNITDTLQAVGGDSTSVNTDWKGGAIASIEKNQGRKCIWLICALHTNELPLRHLVIELDGKTVSDNNFSGQIGKLIHQALDLDLQDTVPPMQQ